MRLIFAIALVACACHFPRPGLESTPAHGQVRLELFERLCSDSVTPGQIVAAQVLNVRNPGGLFAELAVRGADIPQRTFHFDVIGLLDLSYSMATRASATSMPSDAERDGGEPRDPREPGRLCVRAHATLLAAIDEELMRFENGWHVARRQAAGGAGGQRSGIR